MDLIRLEVIFLKLKSSFYNTKLGIKNLVKYFKIIWKIRSYDYHFSIELFIFKLKNDINHIKKNNFIGFDVNPQFKDAFENLELGIDYLEKYLSDYYLNEQYNILDKKYGKLGMDFKKLKDGNYEAIFTRNGISDSEQNEYYKKEDVIRRKLGHRNHENAKIKGFKLISENIDFLWY